MTQASPAALQAPAPQQMDARVRKAAEDFTSVALSALLQPMFEGAAQDAGPYGGGAGEAAWRPMLIDKMAQGIAHGGGLGLTDTVAAAMLRMQEARP